MILRPHYLLAPHKAHSYLRQSPLVTVGVSISKGNSSVSLKRYKISFLRSGSLCYARKYITKSFDSDILTRCLRDDVIIVIVMMTSAFQLYRASEDGDGEVLRDVVIPQLCLPHLRITQVSAGGMHSCALTDTGEVCSMLRA